MHCDDDFSWKKLSRNVLIDLQKGLHILKKPTTKIFRSKYKVYNIHFFFFFFTELYKSNIKLLF